MKLFLTCFLLLNTIHIYCTSYSKSYDQEKFILITSLYNEKNQERAQEYITCMEKNLVHQAIESIYVFYDNQADDEHNNILNYLKSKPVSIIYISGRPSFQKCFDLAHSFQQPAKIIIANADIYFNETLNLLKGYNFSNKFLAITRWDIQKDGSLIPFRAAGSQDAWFFQTPLPQFNDANIFLGMPACDGRIAYEAQRAGLNVLNPCKNIQCCHLHLTDIRHYPPGKVPTYGKAIVVQCGLLPRGKNIRSSNQISKSL